MTQSGNLLDQNHEDPSQQSDINERIFGRMINTFLFVGLFNDAAALLYTGYIRLKDKLHDYE
jgi:hypothetical protein